MRPMETAQGEGRSRSGTGFAELRTPFRDALVIAMCASAVGIAVNLVRSDGIPFIAKEQYRTLVPCPEPGGEVTELGSDDPLLTAPETFLVDARPQVQHLLWKLGGAMNVPYDYLDPTPHEVIAGLADRIAHSRAQRVAVYGDGETPDTGEQLAREISAAGIKNVFFVRGGAPALQRLKARRGAT
jgi:hypothetical protein